MGKTEFESGEAKNDGFLPIEKKILILQAKGLTSLETVNELNNSTTERNDETKETEETVERHIRDLYKKLQVPNRFEAIRAAINKELIPIESFLPEKYWDKPIPQLTERQEQIMSLKLEHPDSTDKEIGLLLKDPLASQDVMNHLTNIRRKYRADNTIHAETIYFVGTLIQEYPETENQKSQPIAIFSSKINEERKDSKKLSPLHKKLIILMGQGFGRYLAAKEVNRLHISDKVEDTDSLRIHLQKAFSLLHVHSIFEAIHKTITKGLIDASHFVPEGYDFKTVETLTEREQAIMSLKLAHPDLKEEELRKLLNPSINFKLELPKILRKYGAKDTVQAATLFLLQQLLANSEDQQNKEIHNEPEPVDVYSKEKIKFSHEAPADIQESFENMLVQGIGIIAGRRENLQGQFFIEAPFVVATMSGTQAEFFSKLEQNNTNYAELIEKLRVDGATDMSIKETPHRFFLIDSSRELKQSEIHILNKLLRRAKNKFGTAIELSEAARSKLR